MPEKAQRYAICVRDQTVLVVDAVSIDQALERAYQILHDVERMQQGDPFTVRPLRPDEPARAQYLRDGYFELLAESSSSTKH